MVLASKFLLFADNDDYTKIYLNIKSYISVTSSISNWFGLGGFSIESYDS